MISKKTLLLASVSAAFLSCGVGHAQSVQGALASGPQSNFARDRNVSVRERPHDGYQAIGLRTGAFMVWPKLTTTAEYNDNIYATGADQATDTVWHITPEVSVTSNWSRHALQAYARAIIHRYTDFASEDTEDYSVGAQGRLDILRTAQANGGFDVSRLTEPRTSSSSPVASKAPIQYDLSSAYLAGAREFNRMKLSGRLDWRKFDYMDGVTTAGTPVRQGDRDRTQVIAMGRADYAVSPDTALFFEISGNNRDYRLNNPPAALYPSFQNRDSQGMQALVGANFDITALVRGELGVGYLKQTFDNPSFNDISGLGARAQVEWFPTQLTTVTLTGSRTVEDAGVIGAAGYLSSNAALQVDHELLRNVILTGQAAYGNDDYRGIDRTDKRFTAGLSATYLLNQNVGLTVGYNHFKQTSSGTGGGDDFTVNKVGATLTLQY